MPEWAVLVVVVGEELLGERAGVGQGPETFGEDRGVLQPGLRSGGGGLAPLDDVRAVQALPAQDRAPLTAVGGVVLGQDRGLELSGEAPPLRLVNTTADGDGDDDGGEPERSFSPSPLRELAVLAWSSRAGLPGRLRGQDAGWRRGPIGRADACQGEDATRGKCRRHEATADDQPRDRVGHGACGE